MSSSTTPSQPREGEAPLPYEDPRRPSFPYYNDEEGKIDLELTIRPHNPPLPFGSNVGAFRDKSIRTYCSDQKRMRHFTQSEWCLAYPLIETPPHQSHNSTRKLRVVDKIAAGENRGAQVLLCLDEDETKKYVAKIYDPLYYTFWDSGPNAHNDCTWMADDDYSREALVYQRLAEFGINGKFTPKFYGCWTFERPLFKDPIVNSPVRLILMEYLPGVCIDWILKSERRTKEITPNHRLDIYAKILEIDTTLDFYGITHNDISPRNVILVGPYKDNSMPKIYFIDFNVAKIDKPLNSEAIAPEWRSIKPVSPRYHHWGEVYDEFVDWVPQPMGMSRIYFNGWLKKVWGDEHPEFSGPSVFKGENFNYESEYKYAEPEKDQIYYE